MSIEVVIICDHCSTIGDGGKTAARARRDLEEKGWERFCDEDYCPDGPCQEALAIERKKYLDKYAEPIPKQRGT